MKNKLDRYLAFCSKELREFILKNIDFVFGDVGILNVTAYYYYVGEINGKKVIKFKADNPKLFTFFHEVGHAYLNHKLTKDNNVYEMQEKEADVFASKILNNVRKSVNF